MTASLPMSHDVDPDEPDERQASAQVVSLPTAGEERAPRALHSKRTPKGRRGTAAPGEAVSAVAIPPPPPVPADLAAAGIVVPPKPPLPARSAQEAAQDGARAELVEPADVLAPPEAPEPENTIRTEAPAEAEAATESATEVTAESAVPAVPVEAALPAEPAPPIDHETTDAAPAMFGDAVAAGVAASATAPAVAPAAPAVAAAATTSAPEVAPVAPALPAEATAVLVAAAAVKPAPVHEPQLLEEVPEALNPPVARGEALVIRGVTKNFGDTHAVEGIDLTVPAGTFYGLVGPNGAGKTTTLSMIAGLLKPDRGSITVAGVDAKAHPLAAKRLMGVLPDRLQIFDRLTGRQLLFYYGVLRGLSPAVVERRTADLARAFDLTDALGRAVSDYSAGMVKKVMLAGALIHSPRLLVLDEPFEAVDPVSSAIILDILSTYVTHGGTVILSSHGMDLVERVCSRVAVLVAGQVLAEGTIDEVRGELTLEQRFIELAGGLSDVEGLEWLHTFSD